MLNVIMLSVVKLSVVPPKLKPIAENPYWLNSVDLLIKIGCFVKKKNVVSV